MLSILTHNTQTNDVTINDVTHTIDVIIGIDIIIISG